MLFVSFALADTWAPYEQGFALPSRDDAPTDAIVLYAANYLPGATVTAGPEAGKALVEEFLVTTGSGSGPLVNLHPVESGWAPETAYELTALGYYDELPVYTLAFSTGTDTAPPPETVEVVGVSYGEWTEDTTFDWGCCHPTRYVTVDVASGATDPWAYVELMGQFAGSGQTTEDLVYQRLAVGIGPGAHRLTYKQWDDDGELQPSSFTVGHVASNGVRGETTDVDGGPERPCTSGCDSGSDSGSDPGLDADTAATTCAGCAAAPSTGLFLVLLAPWWTRRRAHP